jgi:TPR repeat protein
LARAYELGALLPKNLAKSASYYQKAVEKKHKYATYRFAMSLIKGMYTKNKNDKSKKA